MRTVFASWLQAKRRLNKYFALTAKIHHAGTVAEDVTELIRRRKHESKAMEQRAAIILRAFGVWMGLTIELAIHLVIELADATVLAAYKEANYNYSSSSSSYGSSYYNDRRNLGSYSSGYGEEELDYDFEVRALVV